MALSMFRAGTGRPLKRESENHACQHFFHKFAGLVMFPVQPLGLLNCLLFGAFLAKLFQVLHGDGIQGSAPMVSFTNPRGRRWPQPFDQPLPITARWVASLPDEVQPLALLQRLPRIANRLARLWEDDEALQIYFDDILVDRRGGRQGFPPDIHHELLVLWEYWKARHAPAPSQR